MRNAALALVACLAGCSLTGPGPGGECNVDSQCGDDLCARSGECVARSSLREVMVNWTIRGAKADDATCAEHPDLYLQFHSSDYGDTLRYAPVVCNQGQFFVDKLPKRYVQVELGVEGDAGDVIAIESVTAVTARATFHLFQ